MQIGLFGLQNSGKTTLFNALSVKNSESPQQQKSEVSRAIVKVPDARLDKMIELFNPKSQVFATLEVIDIPGLQVSDDNKVKITSEFLNKVKNNNALLHVVRQFENETVPHPEISINAARDIEFLETEFLLADMALIENRIEKLTKDILKLKNDQLQKELAVFKKMQTHVESELPLREMEFDEFEKKILSGYQFLTIKPLIIGINFDENSKDKVESFIKDIQQKFSKYPLIVIPFFAQFEYELTQLSDEEAELFKADFGINESAFTRILRTSYELLGLQSFFTVGEDECRAWTIKKNMTAQDAAGVIHTDFYDRFIRAEVVHYEDYVAHGSFAKCKESGTWRLEGKEYIVKDGDILNIRHS